MSAKPDTSATLRAIAVLEIIVRADRPVSLTEVMGDVTLPKPTVYRILTLLERSGLLLREPDGKRYTVGPRLAPSCSAWSTNWVKPAISPCWTVARLSTSTGSRLPGRCA